MSEIEMSSRGKVLFTLPIILTSIGLFKEEPYVVVTAAFLFSLIFYSLFEVKNCSAQIDDVNL